MTRLALPAVLAACLAAEPAPRPAAAPPVPAPSSPSADPADPLAVLADCQRRFREQVRGYRCVLHKQERTGGVLHPPEVVRLAVREEPYAICLRWESGARGPLGTPIQGAVFAAGADAGRVTIWRPTALISRLRLMAVDPADAAARAASRYAVSEAGIGHALERTVRSWGEAKAAGTLTAEVVGHKLVPEVGRECLVVRRTSAVPLLDPFRTGEPAADPARHPADAFTSVTLMLDPATGAQVGSELRRADGELVGAYYFRELEPNPVYPADQFTPAALRPLR